MKNLLVSIFFIGLVSMAFAQDEEQPKKTFKENLFSGGSISFSFFSNTFLIGGNPVLGYRLANWVDGGIVLNYTYTSYRDYYDDRIRQSVYGGGLFTRLYPVSFLFAQAQYEHNFIHLKYILPNSGPVSTKTTSANSVLVGAGYTSGRTNDNTPFYYLSVLFDISNNTNSPYTDGYGRAVPIIRAGINFPLFKPGRH